MTVRKLTVALAAIALMLGSFAINSYVNAAHHEKAAYKGPKYEYLVQGKREMDRREGEGLQGEFNNLGQQGWKLVAVLPGKDDAFSVVFMREMK